MIHWIVPERFVGKDFELFSKIEFKTDKTMKFEPLSVWNIEETSLTGFAITVEWPKTGIDNVILRCFSKLDGEDVISAIIDMGVEYPTQNYYYTAMIDYPFFNDVLPRFVLKASETSQVQVFTEHKHINFEGKYVRTLTSSGDTANCLVIPEQHRKKDSHNAKAYDYWMFQGKV